MRIDRIEKDKLQYLAIFPFLLSVPSTFCTGMGLLRSWVLIWLRRTKPQSINSPSVPESISAFASVFLLDLVETIVIGNEIEFLSPTLCTSNPTQGDSATSTVSPKQNPFFWIASSPV
jgi:hypothetical protein